MKALSVCSSTCLEETGRHLGSVVSLCAHSCWARAETATGQRVIHLCREITCTTHYWQELHLEPSGGDKEVSISPSAPANCLSAEQIPSAALRLCGQRTPREQTRPLGGPIMFPDCSTRGSQNTSISTEMFSPHQSRQCFFFLFKSINVTVNTIQTRAEEEATKSPNRIEARN